MAGAEALTAAATALSPEFCRRLLPRTRSAEIRNARILYETLFPAFGPLSRRCNRPIISIKIGRYQKCKDFIGDLGSCVWTGPSADPARRLTDRRQRRSHLLHLQRYVPVRQIRCLAGPGRTLIRIIGVLVAHDALAGVVLLLGIVRVHDCRSMGICAHVKSQPFKYLHSRVRYRTPDAPVTFL